MAVPSLNKVLLIGNLTRDPEMRYTSSGTAVCTFGLATNRSWAPRDGGERQEEVQYHRIVAWSKLAEICVQILAKGRKVYVEGRLQTNKWTGKDNIERETAEIVIDNMIALSPPPGSSGGYGGSVNEGDIPIAEPGGGETSSAPSKTSTAKKATSGKTTKSKKQEEVDVDDIPF